MDEKAAQPTRQGARTPRPGKAEEARVVAFSEFYRAFVPRLVAFLLCQGAQLAEATDVAQDAMIQAYRHWDSIEVPAAWTRKVASRLLVRRVASVEETPRDGTVNPLVGSNNIADWLDNDEFLEALRELPPRQRQVLAWSFDGYSHSEIATELNISLEAVASNLFKARRALASRLRRNEGR